MANIILNVFLLLVLIACAAKKQNDEISFDDLKAQSPFNPEEPCMMVQDYQGEGSCTKKKLISYSEAKNLGFDRISCIGSENTRAPLGLRGRCASRTELESKTINLKGDAAIFDWLDGNSK